VDWKVPERPDLEPSAQVLVNMGKLETASYKMEEVHQQLLGSMPGYVSMALQMTFLQCLLRLSDLNEPDSHCADGGWRG
jgi:hypothetical protein